LTSNKGSIFCRAPKRHEPLGNKEHGAFQLRGAPTQRQGRRQDNETRPILPHPDENFVTFDHSMDCKDGELPAKTSAEFAGEVQGSLSGRAVVMRGQYGRRERGTALGDQNRDAAFRENRQARASGLQLLQSASGRSSLMAAIVPAPLDPIVHETCQLQKSHDGSERAV
jgi:hypothetical protein